MFLLRLLRKLFLRDGLPRGTGRGLPDGDPRRLAELRFPVLLIHNGTSVRVLRNPEGLEQMHVNHVVLPSAAPMLIDSDLNVYSLERLRSTRGGLWLLVHPSGTTPVIFELTPKGRGGADAARELLLSCKYLDADPDDDARKRRALGAERTLAGFIAVLNCDPAGRAR
jgi:hypothetical protein